MSILGNLIGGIFANSARKKAEAREDSQLQRLVADAQKAGFNPLSALRSGTSYAGTSTPSLSTASFIADAVDGGVDLVTNKESRERQGEIEKLELEIQKQKLADLQNQNKVRSDYGFSIPNVVKQTTGLHDADATRSIGSSFLSYGSGHGIGSSSSVAPNREVMSMPYSSGAGLTEINNAFTDGSIVVPGADGEPWGIDEVATAFFFGVPQMATRGLSGFAPQVKKNAKTRKKLTEKYQSNGGLWGQLGFDKSSYSTNGSKSRRDLRKNSLSNEVPDFFAP